MVDFQIQRLGAGDRGWTKKFLLENWGSERMVSRGKLHHPADLDGYVATCGHTRVGLVTFRIENGECEVITVNSTVSNRGIGTSLLEAVKKEAIAKGCRRVWLITTNDNTPALRFYQKRGFRLVSVYPNVMEESRRLKPEIPLVGMNGVPLRDEIELEILLG